MYKNSEDKASTCTCNDNYAREANEVLYAVAHLADRERVFHSFGALLPGLAENTRILDSSCCNGIKTAALAKGGYRVVETAISSEMIRMTRMHEEKNFQFFFEIGYNRGRR